MSTADVADYRRRTEVCRALTDPKRLMLIDLLRGDARSVGDLARELAITLANASQHLAVLRSVGLVISRREGSSVWYRLRDPWLAKACDIVGRVVADQTRQPVG